MGGADSQGFRIFSELVTKAFLACRPYAEQIIEVCSLMIGTDLPSFKGTPTIDRLRDRFKLEMTERQAAKHAQYLIKDGFENREFCFVQDLSFLERRRLISFDLPFFLFFSHSSFDFLRRFPKAPKRKSLSLSLWRLS